MAKNPDSKDDSFVNVWFSEDSTDGTSIPSKIFQQSWSALASAKHSSPKEYAANALRKAYPNYSLVMSSDYGLNVLRLPGVNYKALDDIPLILNTTFATLSRMNSPVPGTLVDSVQFGGFDVSWEGHSFVVYILVYPQGSGTIQVTYILHEGENVDPARTFLLANGIWRNELHDEIWVFNQGFWDKDAALFREIQKANWDEVILKEDYKKTLQKDVQGFFTSRELYKKLAIPWKRGLIMYGPPGNGKTISLKAIMKDCAGKGYAPLYVKSFKSFMGEEFSMAQVFDKARQLAPCVLILEDLDSLINDGNRSFFLNQLDGLSGNDGLFLIGTTNHFDRLDPGLSTRPSRFDRKYLFDDPDIEERTLYAKYWQNKLKDNSEISFPDSLIKVVAESTHRFSFAYLKEAFVSSLVIMAGFEDKDKPNFGDILQGQIKILSKQLDKASEQGQPAKEDGSRDIRALLESLSQYVESGQRQGKVPSISDLRGIDENSDRNLRTVLDRISAGSMQSVFAPSVPGAWSQMYAVQPTNQGQGLVQLPGIRR